MDKELKELLLKLGTSIGDLATGINALKSGQDLVLETLKGKKPPPKDDGDEPDDDDAKKALKTLTKQVAALTTRCTELEGTCKELEEIAKQTNDGVELIAKQMGVKAS